MSKVSLTLHIEDDCGDVVDHEVVLNPEDQTRLKAFMGVDLPACADGVYLVLPRVKTEDCTYNAKLMRTSYASTFVTLANSFTSELANDPEFTLTIDGDSHE